MSTALAPQQTDRKAWSQTRLGEFTGSTNGDLMTEPRSKAAREAGELSETAKTLIATKATEIVKGKEVRSAWDWSMKRGFVLESAFKYLLSKYWQPVDDCTMQSNGLWISTPDGLLRNGEPLDIKCPNEVDVLMFADEVPDGNWEALKKWNKGYAYQILTQAQACGSRFANLTYCTDMIKTIMLDETDIRVLHGEGLHDEHGGLIGEACQRLFDETGSMFNYTFNDAYNEPGFTFINRRVEIPQSEIEAMERAIKTAIAERDRKVIEFGRHLSPAPEAVEAVAQLLEGQDIETDEQMDVRSFERMLDHLTDFPSPTNLKSAIARMSMQKIAEHIKAAKDIAEGTLAKDLK